MDFIEVAAAVIKKDGFYLCAQRKVSKYNYLSKKFEFPGGKVEEGETLQEALIREIYEELGVKIFVQQKIKNVKHCYPDFNVDIAFFACNLIDNNNLSNLEHEKIIWMEAQELISLDWAAADIPIVNLLCDNKLES
ncbi:(deoxy)nucleoside triphosphate pyrophosphohydrolase [Acinetobacter nectaris]|uniref:(deoxy)nucleoside triphosphate pyrophosphohydrolase n=1 Tax=Acinetobacter nectaris TaxID=1219382 RepID=UPI001F1DB794|nr:(deoxy)nucleoside triphosphate pyrophosphohydrolase [Acinetobacter nectaris]MCF9045739.1 (deoxy)nucleoside triphosphate pyrophosphohydrolase [Acinetobacter nectaris]